MKRRYSLGIVITLMLFASALTWAGTVLITGVPFVGLGSSRANYVRDYAALLARIEEYFIGEYEEGEIATAAMRAAVAALGDEWSFFMTQEEFERNQDSTRNRYQGIGVNVISDEATGNIRITNVFSGSAAETAGIISGDMIIEVDGESVTGITLAELRYMLLRPIGESAEIGIEREDGTVETVTVIYSFVYVNPVSFEMLEGLVGYIRLANFHGGSAQHFISAANELIGQGALGFVFDMRGNPGGWVTEMSEILDFLLPEGEIFVAVNRSGMENITMSGPEHVDLPMVVIVDRFSFSGAEYFAAMLREFGFAEIVGEQTTGKSRMQRAVRIPGGGAINISFAEYLTKNRVSLHDEGGVTPDHPVTLTDEERILFLTGNLDKEMDPQLQKALQILAIS
ncbi:MAG: S41 family peptidase [Oscillospiraceae bacterium]|nr:S41 family peptidase [Oscillospiraceae bacterium]